MTTNILASISNSMADAVAAAAPSVVQVQGGRRPASGLVYSTDVVVTTARALGRDDRLHIRRDDGEMLEAELAGWDPTTNLVVLSVSGMSAKSITAATAVPRVGQLALAVGRSWSNAVSASAGIVAVIGGPLHTGRHQSIEQVLRTTAPMHDGFAGGALIDADGALLGITTSTAIRGTTVVIPASIAWKTAENVLRGVLKRGYLGISVQQVNLAGSQRDESHSSALLVAGVIEGGPAAKGGMLVGDIIVAVDGQHVEAPQDLFDLLVGERVGRELALQILRGQQRTEIRVMPGDRPKS